MRCAFYYHEGVTYAKLHLGQMRGEHGTHVGEAWYACVESTWEHQEEHGKHVCKRKTHVWGALEGRGKVVIHVWSLELKY